MTITYNLGIPAAANNPSSDQPNMLTNTNNIASYVAVDHVAFNTAGSGTHNQVTFAGPQAPSTPSNPVSILYTIADGSGNPQLNFLNSQAITNSVIASGTVFLFGGLILQWGQVNNVGNGTVITFPIAFPNNLFNVQVTGFKGSPIWTGNFGILDGAGTNKSQFTIIASLNTPIPIYWLALGN